MVGKLDLGQGENSGFYPRLARANAEQNQTQEPDPQIALEGPFKTDGVAYWLLAQTLTPTYATISVGFDVDDDPNPDFFIPLKQFMDNPTIDQQAKDDVRQKVLDLWGV